MENSIVQFIVVALICALGLWALSRFPNLDGTIVSLIRIVVIIALSLLALNVILMLLFGKGISGYLGHG